MLEETLPYQIQLQSFSGPLDLLLHLIEREELDIYQIPIAHVTDQYLAYLRSAAILQMELASEFMVMAATLIAMKARSLLPKPPVIMEDMDDEESVWDDELSLTQKLLEYKAFREIAGTLKVQEQARQELVGRFPLPLDSYREEPSGLLSLAGVDLGLLQQAFMRAITRTHPERDISVMRDRETIPERMRRIEAILRKSPVTFQQLLQSRHRREIVTVFLAVLELIRMQKVTCTQEGRFGEIWITKL